LLDFHAQVSSQELPPLRMGGVVPVDMHGYPLIFGTTRVPGEECDALKTNAVLMAREGAKADPRYGDAHIVVTVGSHMFKVMVQEHGKRASAAAIRATLASCQSAAEEHPDGIWGPPNVALLTTNRRDVWGKQYAALKGDEVNAAALQVVEDALFHVCLHEDSPEEDVNAVQRLSWHGDGRHIWFDKCFTVLVFANGLASISVEHTFADAPVPSHMWEYALIHQRDEVPSEGDGSMAAPALIEWRDFDQPSSSMWLRQAGEAFEALTSTVAMHVHIHNDWGKNKVKAFGIAPDAACQAILALTARKFFGAPVLTYESASHRAFHLGRTETIRSASGDMVAFAAAMVEGKSSEECEALLRAAAKTHRSLTKAAMRGDGVDRHMLGLKLAAITTGRPLPAVFATRAANLPYKLSTSQTPLVQQFVKLDPRKMSYGGGFGPVADGGVGVSYFVLPDFLYFHCSYRCDKPGESADFASPAEGNARWVSLLKESLDEMSTLLEGGAKRK
jgi:carnitine O-acetyltransferase